MVLQSRNLLENSRLGIETAVRQDGNRARLLEVNEDGRVGGDGDGVGDRLELEKERRKKTGEVSQ